MAFRIRSSPVVWTLAAAFVIFTALSVVLPADGLIRFLNYALIFVAFGLTVGYLPEVWQAIKERRYTMLGLYATGVLLMWAGIFMNRLWAEIVSIVGAEWMRTAPIVSIYLFIFLLAGLLQLSAPGVVDGRMPKRTMIKLGLVLGGAVGVSLLLWSLGFGRVEI